MLFATLLLMIAAASSNDLVHVPQPNADVDADASHPTTVQAPLSINIASDHSLACTKMFKPTLEFQVVGIDECIPKGLHVRMNMESGLKEAKLMGPVPSHNDEGENDLPPRISVQADDNINVDTLALPRNKKSEALDENPLTSDVLEAYEVEVAGIDEGAEFMRLPLSDRLFAVLTNEAAAPEGVYDTEFQAQAARVLGAALSNNQKAQSIALSKSYMPQLLSTLSRSSICTTTTTTSSKSPSTPPSTPPPKSLLFLLGAFLRGNLDATLSFQKQNGISILYHLRDRVKSSMMVGKELPVGALDEKRRLVEKIEGTVEDLLNESFTSVEDSEGWAAVRRELKKDIDTYNIL